MSVNLFKAIVILLACACLSPLKAQDLQCSEVVESAFASIPQHCAELGRDELCYSHPYTEASFADAAQATSFEMPAQRVSVADLSSIRTSGLDLEGPRWGVAVLNLGANLPRTRAGPGVIVMLAGAAEVVNDIEAGAVEINEPLSTAALVDTTLYRHPGIIPEALETVAADELLLVDAYDDTGDWLRVVNDGGVAWVEGKDVARLQSMEGLPMMDVAAAFPFRALSVATESDFPACDEAEALVALQTPADAPVSLTVNGVDIHIGSMVTFQQVHGNALSLTVHRGKATTTSGQIARQGESVIGILGRGRDGDWQVLDWSGVVPASAAENARGQRAQEALNHLARVNGWPEHRTFTHPPATAHIVERGDSLYSIARLYETSVAEIILANLGDEPIKLYAGMSLVIPKPGSGFAGHGDVPLDATREN